MSEQDKHSQSPPAEEAPRIYKAARSREDIPKKPVKPPKTPEQLAYEAARRERFRVLVWGPWLSPLVALVAICVVTSLLLGLTNELTAPLIAANTEAAATAGREALLPEADGFEPVELDGLPAEVTAMYKATNGAGWVVESYGRGYGGKVPAMTAFDSAGNIVGVTFLENTETPGLGQKLVSDASFAAQFDGRPAQSLALSDVDKIASATISTGAAVNAVNAAIEAYEVKALGESLTGGLSPEQVRESLLPGEALTEIALTAPDVQPAAWRSDAGNYIIYGEQLSEGSGSTVTAAVAMNGDGVVLNLWIDTSGESEQFGQTLATNQAFLDSFVGESVPVTVDTVADITHSSTSVIEAVNHALAALPQAKEAA